MATECFKEFLARSKAEKLQKHIEENNGWQLLENENTFSDGLEIIVRLASFDRTEPLIILSILMIFCRQLALNAIGQENL